MKNIKAASNKNLIAQERSLSKQCRMVPYISDLHRRLAGELQSIHREMMIRFDDGSSRDCVHFDMGC